MRRAFVQIVILGCLFTSCGQADAPPGPGTQDIGCRNDPLAEVFTSNMQKAGSGGVFTFVLRGSDPAPPARGTDTWTLGLLDQAGNPVTDASLTITPFMPKHGHGTSVVPGATAAGDDYDIAPLYFFMPGLWQVTLDAEAGSLTDTAVFSFCIEG